jgi:hypothetical protein
MKKQGIQCHKPLARLFSELIARIDSQGSAGVMPAEIVALFHEYGHSWGGDWTGKSRDSMHFLYVSGL